MSLQENVAYSTEYNKKRMDSMDILDEKNFIEKEETILSNGDLVVFRNYEKIDGDRRYSGSMLSLHRKCNTIFTFDMSVDSGCLICNDIIKHQNGKQYLLFRTELYGYSVLNLKTLEVHHYIPSGSITGEESFIWCEAVYCNKNNLLYVSGCYWACPYSTLVVDFSHPETMPFRDFDLVNMFDVFDEDIDPIRWKNDGSLIYKTANQTYTMSNEKIISLLSKNS